jgi:hypothetical protein
MLLNAGVDPHHIEADPDADQGSDFYLMRNHNIDLTHKNFFFNLPKVLMSLVKYLNVAVNASIRGRKKFSELNRHRYDR